MIGEVAMCAYVLQSVANAERLLARIDASITTKAFVALSAMNPDSHLDPLWQYFHKEPRRAPPSFLDAIDLLDEMGISVELELVEVPSLTRFPSVADAVSEYAQALFLPWDSDTRSSLARVLSSWLVWREGAWRPPLATGPAAILSWSPRERIG